MKTPIIEYNLADRGRQYRGQNRNFNLRKIAAAINSPETQEMVKNGDMHGFYGHWLRVKYGLFPSEKDLDKEGVAPAFTTIKLTAKEDGTVQHQARFVNTTQGRRAMELFNAKIGGFSSAIDEHKPVFAGFDYVREPNYANNRGFEIVLDSVSGQYQINGMTLDQVIAADYNDQLEAAWMLISQLTHTRDMALDSVQKLAEENEDLYSLLASNSHKNTLDDASPQKPIIVSSKPARMLLDDINSFKTLHLPKFVEPVADDSAFKELTDRFLHRH